MSVALAAWANLPSMEAQCQLVAQDLQAGRSVLWLMPRTAPLEELVSTVCHELWRASVEFREVNLLIDPGLGSPPASRLATALGLELEYPGVQLTPESLVQHENWPQVVVIVGLEGLTPEVQGCWARFVSEWANLAANRAGEPGSGPPALLLPVRGSPAVLPREDALLVMRYWWGCASRTEVEFVVRKLLGTGVDGYGWAETVYPEVAGPDPELLARLLEGDPVDGPELGHALRQYASERGWERQHLVDGGALQLLRRSVYGRLRSDRRVPRQWLELWEMGALHWTAEYGLELNAAALAVLERTDLIDQRIWRAQVRVLLPLLDGVRRLLCRYLTDKVGPAWIQWARAEHWGEVQDTAEGPVSGFGHLQSVLESGLLPPRLHSELSEPVALFRKIRNDLAHYMPIRLSLYEEFRKAVERVEHLR